MPVGIEEMNHFIGALSCTIGKSLNISLLPMQHFLIISFNIYDFSFFFLRSEKIVKLSAM